MFRRLVFLGTLIHACLGGAQAEKNEDKGLTEKTCSKVCAETLVRCVTNTQESCGEDYSTCRTVCNGVEEKKEPKNLKH
jgi:hypothetical protein